jgi:hypothetical protein
VTVAVLTAALTACGPVETTGAEWPALPQQASLVPHTVVAGVHTTEYSALRERDRRAILTAGEWEAFWLAFHGPLEPKPDAPVIDFSRQMVLVAAMGERATGGYQIAIESVYRAAGKLLVRVEETAPGAGCILTQALTAPVTAVVVARSEEAVEFQDRTIVVSCG